MEEDKQNNIIDSESHNSYDSSHVDVSELPTRQFINFTVKKSRYYSSRVPSSSFPNSKHTFSKKRMNEIRFDELEFKVGQPYIYKHQDHCRHYFTI